MRIRTTIFFYLGCIWNFITPAHAVMPLPKQDRVPGGVAIIDIETNGSQPPVVHYLGHRALVMTDPKVNNKWITVIGIPLDATPGINNIEVNTGKEVLQKTFIVKSKNYPTEQLTIKDHNKVEPPAEESAIIEAQYLETIQTYTNWQDATIDSVGLAVPVFGRKSSPFGLTRVLNGIPKNPHSGLDFAAPLGAKVRCPKDGRVINIGNYFFSGNIVFVDHGQGFITSYCHLNTVAVTKGQELKHGDVIGTVGKTGRATGPHLHWSVNLNGARVNPQLFIHG